MLVPFPFSNLSQVKLRPALVLADAGQDDWILCQITSNPYADPRAVRLVNSDFSLGSLARESFVRPGKLFTAHRSLVARPVGQIAAAKLAETRKVLIRLLR